MGRKAIKTAVALIIAIAGAACAYAGAYPPEGLSTQFTQPDGTILKLKVFGSEYYAETRTADGYTVVFDPDSKTYYYAKQGADGSLVSTGVAAQNTKPAGLDIAPGVKASGAYRSTLINSNEKLKERNERWRKLKEERRKETESAPSGAFYSPPSHTTTGSYTGLCIIAQFLDESGDFTRSQIDDFCNKTGYSDYGNAGSVKDYYYTQSNGLLTYTNTVTAYVTLPQKKDYYNNTSKDSGECGRLLVQNALAILVENKFDFSQISKNAKNNMYATNVFFSGANSGVWSKGLWPNQWNLETPYKVADNICAYGYQITNMGFQKDGLGIGTFCHENGHLLCDYVDYYDARADATSSGIGNHCLMSWGNGLNSDRTPAPINAYLKWKSGWLTPFNISIGKGGRYYVPTKNTFCYSLMKSSTEYFIVENRQKTGWGAYLPAAGLAIWHVDETKDGNTQPEMTTAQHYELSLEQANGLYQLERDKSYGGSPTDYFRAQTYTNFSFTTNPIAKWWSGANPGFAVSNISVSGDPMSFDLNGTPGKKLQSDYNKDGKSDLMLQNMSSSAMTMWFMNGVSPGSTGDISSVSALLVPVASGDFNNDGYADLLMRNKTTNAVSIYLMRDNTVQSSAVIYDGGDSAWRVAGTGDFNGDGKCDILWQHENSGMALIYIINDTQMLCWGVVYNSAAPLKAAAVGDLNGDGKADIIWRNASTGAVTGYLMNGLDISSAGVIYDGSDPNWTPVAMGDLDGDGKDDIVWQNSSTQAAMAWLMDGLTVKSQAVIFDGADKNWRVAGMGDYNGDGCYDIVWRNVSTGQLSVWLMNGTTMISSGVPYAGGDLSLASTGDTAGATLTVGKAGEGAGSCSFPDGANTICQNTAYQLTATASTGSRFAGWTLSGNARILSNSATSTKIILYGAGASITAAFDKVVPGDFNGDAKADLLWQNSSTAAGAVWLMDGFTRNDGAVVYNGGDTDWEIVGKGDLDGDGKCDIVWRNKSSGTALGYLMNGLTLKGWGTIYNGGDPGWKVAAVGDVNGDGKADLIWRNSSNGQVIIYLMNGCQMTSYQLIFDSNPDWLPVSSADFNGDGKWDILWRNSSNGQVSMWLMDGFTTLSASIIFDSDKNWVPRQTGDLDGDGKADIVWRNTQTGAVAGWLMNGAVSKQVGFIATPSGATWDPADCGDYNGDGKSDICLRDSSDGSVNMMLMNGLSISSQQVIFKDNSWRLIGTSSGN